MAAELLTGLSIFKSMLDTARGLKDINDAANRNAAVIELQEKILTAQAQQTELIERISALENELVGFRTWEYEKKRYQLRDYGGGTYAYELKEAEANDEPIHRLCPNCYQHGHKSILQFRYQTMSSQDKFTCLSCDTEFEFGDFIPAPPRRRVVRHSF